MTRFMLTAKQIIDRFDGAKKLSDELALPLTTVASWTAANFIPEWRQRDVLAAAERLGVALSTADFPTPAVRVARGKAQAA